MNYQWPDCFINGQINYENNTAGKLAACADALCGWGNVHAGASLPSKFAEAMNALGDFIGVLALEDDISAEADRLMAIYQQEKKG